MTDPTEHFLTSLYVHNAFAVQDLEIPIGRGGDRRRHLIITGPNGSGKSTVLAALHQALRTYPNSPVSGRSAATQLLEQYDVQLASNPSETQRRQLEQARATMAQNARMLDATALVEVRALPAVFDATKTLLAFIPANRSLSLQRPQGPTRIDERRFIRSTQQAPALLLQFLVNLRMEQALAREDGADSVADRIGDRFGEIEEKLCLLLDDEQARLRFDRTTYDFTVELGDGRAVSFDKLPDGISSILFMWASLMIPAEAILRAGISEPSGWAIIDEPELHLHARLQEMVLPFLTTMFPNIQFIVATHSPAVVASLPNATIFDLRSREVIDSVELHGIRYGTILTKHFGIETDFDVETTRKLKRLKALSDVDLRAGSPEYEEMRMLARELSDVRHLLVAQITKRLDLDVA